MRRPLLIAALPLAAVACLSRLTAPPGAETILLVSDRSGASRIEEMSLADGAAREVGGPPRGGAAAGDGAMGGGRSYQDSMPARLPDGRIAFVSDRDGVPRMYLVSADGASVTPLTRDPAGTGPAGAGAAGAPPAAADSDPAPLGRDRIVFARQEAGSPRGSARDLYLIGIDGHGLRRLTRDPADDHAPAGSPDGRSVVFVSDRSGAPRLLVLRDLDAAALPESGLPQAMPLAASPPLPPGAPGPWPADGAPAFLPDGTLVFRRAFSATLFHLFATEGSGREARVRQITDGLSLPWGADEPVALPDDTILFVTGPVPPAKGMEGPPRFAVYRIAAGGFNLSRVTRERARYDDFTRRLDAR